MLSTLARICISLTTPNSCSCLKLHCFCLKELPVPEGYPEKTKCDQHNMASLKAKYTDLKEYIALKYH